MAMMAVTKMMADMKKNDPKGCGGGGICDVEFHGCNAELYYDDELRLNCQNMIIHRLQSLQRRNLVSSCS